MSTVDVSNVLSALVGSLVGGLATFAGGICQEHVRAGRAARGSARAIRAELRASASQVVTFVVLRQWTPVMVERPAFESLSSTLADLRTIDALEATHLAYYRFDSLSTLVSVASPDDEEGRRRKRRAERTLAAQTCGSMGLALRALSAVAEPKRAVLHGELRWTRVPGEYESLALELEELVIEQEADP